MCVVCWRRDGEGRMLGFWDKIEGDMGCGCLEKEVELVAL